MWTHCTLCALLCYPCGPFSIFSKPARHPAGMIEPGFGHIAFRSLWPERAGPDRGSEFQREDARKPAMDLGAAPKQCKWPNGHCDPSNFFFFRAWATAAQQQHTTTQAEPAGYSRGRSDCWGVCTLPTPRKLTIILPDRAERGRGRFLRRRRRLRDDERLEPCTGP